MKLLSETGILYDAAAYCTAYFAAESGSFLPNSIFFELSEEVSSLPKIIAPFFLRSNSLPTPVFEYWKLKQFSSCGSISALTELLTDEDERDSLRQIVLNTLFYPDIASDEDNHHSDCSVKTAVRLDKTDYHADFKYQALLCLTYFRHAVTELCRTLAEVGRIAEKLHEKYDSEISAVFSEMRSGKYNKLYAETAGFDPDSFNEITVSFSILHPDVLLSSAEDRSLALIVGINHTDELIRAFDEDSIDIGSFLEDMGNELRRMILEALAENGELTASDISRCTGIPVTTALRHMEALCGDYLITVSHRKGLQIFYTLNREYLEKARRKTDRYLKNLTSIE